ncbi:MAG: hypothetical protein WDA16_14625, partial [Candidatus Thermoplasmatota archaeon]
GQLVRIMFAAQGSSAVVDDVVLDADVGTIARASLNHGPHPRVEEEWRSNLFSTFEAHDGLAAHLLPLDDGSFLAVLVEYGPSGARVLPIKPNGAQLAASVSSPLGAGTNVTASAQPVALSATPYGRLFAESGLAGEGLRLRPDVATQPLAWRVTLAPEGVSLYSHNASGFLNLGKLLDPANPADDALDAIPDVLLTQAPAALFEDSDGDGYLDLVELELGSSPNDAQDVPGRNAAQAGELTTRVANATARVSAIRAPLSTMPSFLAPGENLTIELNVTAPTNVTAILVPALGRIGASVLLNVSNNSAGASSSTRWPGATVNVMRFIASLPHDVNASALDRLYDLRVDWLGGNDTQPRAVEVVSGYAVHPRVAIVADPRWASASSPLQNATDPLATIIPELNLLRPDLVLIVGDLTQDGGATELEGAYAAIQGLEVPSFVVAGDRDLAATPSGDGTALWQSIFGPLYYPIDYGPSFHGVALDTADWLYTDRVGTSGVSLTQGAQVRAAQLAWVQQDLAQSNASMRIAFGHHSPAWAQDAWQHASLENAAAGPQGTDAVGYLRVLLGAFGRYLPTPLDAASNAPAAITTGAEEGWTGAGRLELRDALRAGGVSTYFAGHTLADRVAQERDDGVVVEANGHTVHLVARDDTNQTASLADFDLGNQTRVLYLDTTAAGNHSAEYAGYRLYEINGTRGSGLWDGYDPAPNASLAPGWDLTQREVGLFSVPSGHLSENVSTIDNETFVNITSGLDEGANVTFSLTFHRQPGRAWAREALISREWRVDDDRDVLVPLRVENNSNISTRVYVDANAPNTRIQFAPAWANATVFNVKIGNASDDHQLADVSLQTCRIDACDPWRTVRSNLTKDDIVLVNLPAWFGVSPPQGAYALRTIGRDAAGNSEAPPNETSPDVTTVGLDTVPPELDPSAEGPAGSDGWFLGNVTVNASCMDATSGCVDAAGNVSPPGARLNLSTTPVTDDGWHNITITAEDAAGNPTTRTREVKIDSHAPVTIAQLAPAITGNWSTSNVTLYLNATDET